MRTKCVATIVVMLIAVALQAFATGDIYVADGDDTSKALFVNKGFELSKKGQYDKALAIYDAALRRDPKDWVTLFNRASVYMDLRKWNLAMQNLNQTIRVRPDFLMASIMRCWVNERLGNYKSSLADYNVMLTFHLPENTQAAVIAGRAWLEATCPNPALRNGKQAVDDARVACNITSWGKADYLDTMAAAEAEVGDFADAMQFEQRAIKHCRDKSNAASYARHLEAFQQHHPIRTGPG